MIFCVSYFDREDSLLIMRVLAFANALDIDVFILEYKRSECVSR